MSAVLPPLIDGAALASRLGRPSLVILDASAAKPGEAYDPATVFRAAHLPGAQVFDLDLFSDPDATFPHTVPSATRFGRLAGALGIGGDTTVVVYEQRRLFSAARAWYLFRLFGHDDVLLLDGGLAVWRGLGLPMETGDAMPRAAARFTPRLRTGLLAGLGDVVRPGAGDVLLDARSAGRFAGTAPEPRPAIPSGHIPGSRNLPYDELIGEDGRMKDRDTLRALFESRGVGPASDVVTSCGTGVTASVLSLGLVVAGFREAALYDGSWTEYATLTAPNGLVAS